MESNFGDPGAVQFGNFINYYQFNSVEERIKILPNERLWNSEEGVNGNTALPSSEANSYLVLDVGCNSGVFTKSLYEFLTNIIHHKTVYVYAVDIDAQLIERARSKNVHSSITFDCCNVMDAKDFLKIHRFLKMHKRLQFDAVCCFAITMWIHLNHNDEGLQKFLKQLSDIAMLMVIEPQPWKCYQTAQRRLRKVAKNFKLFPLLQWRSNVVQCIEHYMQEILQRNKIYETTPTKWQRKICLYR